MVHTITLKKRGSLFTTWEGNRMVAHFAITGLLLIILGILLLGMPLFAPIGTVVIIIGIILVVIGIVMMV